MLGSLCTNHPKTQYNIRIWFIDSLTCEIEKRQNLQLHDEGVGMLEGCWGSDLHLLELCVCLTAKIFLSDGLNWLPNSYHFQISHAKLSVCFYKDMDERMASSYNNTGGGDRFPSCPFLRHISFYLNRTKVHGNDHWLPPKCGEISAEKRIERVHLGFFGTVLEGADTRQY